MNRSKKTVLIVLCVVLLTVGIGALCIGLQVAPTVNHALRIAELLQPVVDAENQTMHIAVSAEFGGNDLSAESDIYLVREDDAPYDADYVVFLEGRTEGVTSHDIQPLVVEEIAAVTRQVAEKRGCTLIDIHSFTAAHPEWFAKDGVHPGNEGAAAIAQEVASILTAQN